MALQTFAPNINFAKSELEALTFWDDHKIFERSVSEKDPKTQYVFYDGPPFATGLPHYGHLLASILKDIIPRYWTMKGHRVERRFGWDCHGLPVEHEIDKSLKLEGKQAIEDYGIAKYNEACRSIVLKYTNEWEKTIHRVGRWVDFKNCYKTMDLSYMESVWWVFKSLWDQGLIYEGYKVMPYSTACATPLSNFEANSNYKEVQDPSITVIFKKKGASSTFFMAWTTTPWTLPSNLALIVHPKEEYVEVEDSTSKNKFILAKKRLLENFKDANSYTILNTFKGKDLAGQHYAPLFDYFLDHKNAFQVLCDSFVTMEDGTGIVHAAPGFGEEDYRVCKTNHIKALCPIDDDGKFTKEVSHYAGYHVKEADSKIIKRLKEEEKIIKHTTIQHNYPFCWRSDTPLIYRAVSSWFVNVEKIKSKIISANQKTNWVPNHLKDGRFGKWLEGARDWAISRNRYWGCTIPIWKNTETNKTICVGSVEELEKLSGNKIKDIHRHFIDDVTFKIKGEKGTYKRISEVLDCWFESGSMPYAQAHYPFENKKKFEETFPANFIAEGLDQTRGWFYTLTILGTILFKKSPFKNVIVNGLILAEDGKKMSKRLKNYPDPSHVLEKHGADALRLFLINSPAVRAEEFRFSEQGVQDVVRRVLLKWWNSYSFYMSYASIEAFTPSEKSKNKSDNIFDQWILSKLQTLIKNANNEMSAYKLYNVVPALIDFIEDLTNTYIRFNRKRFWSEKESNDKQNAFETLYTILIEFTKVMAPFTPFLSERTYQQLLKNQKIKKDSVHLDNYPTVSKILIQSDLEATVKRLQNIVVMARNLREKIGAKVKIPLKTLTIVHRNKKILDHFKDFESTLKDELNIRAIVYDSNENNYIELQTKPNHKSLGPKFGKEIGKYIKQISKLDEKHILELEQKGFLTILNQKLTQDDIKIMRLQQKEHQYTLSNPFITISMDPTIEEDQLLEGKSREIVNRIQKMRKTADFNLDDRIDVQFFTETSLAQVISQHKDYICAQVLAKTLTESKKPSGQLVEECMIDKEKVVFGISVIS